MFNAELLKSFVAVAESGGFTRAMLNSTSPRSARRYRGLRATPGVLCSFAALGL
jgi:DNA-binding transcriptional LysR family regulator